MLSVVGLFFNWENMIGFIIAIIVGWVGYRVYLFFARQKIFEKYVGIDLNLYFSKQPVLQVVTDHGEDHNYGSLLITLSHKDHPIDSVVLSGLYFLEKNYRFLHFSPFTFQFKKDTEGHLTHSFSFLHNKIPSGSDGSLSIWITGRINFSDGDSRRFAQRVKVDQKTDENPEVRTFLK